MPSRQGENRFVNILTIDVGGTHVKILVSGETEGRRFPSGPKMTPAAMISGVKALADGWKYDVATIGFPGPVKAGHIIGEPHNLASGWIGFDFAAALGCPVRLVNDAAMQALGSYKGGKMLFLGLGTGLGTTMVVDGIILPMELGHLPYKRGTFEDYIGERGLKRTGKRKWQAHVADVTARLIRALMPDDVVLGGGNVRLLDPMPSGCRAGENSNAFFGGFRIWKDGDTR
jgi:polyphosphate glucokinase